MYTHGEQLFATKVAPTPETGNSFSLCTLWPLWQKVLFLPA